MSRVLFFINSLTGGGAERVGYEMIKALSREHSVRVVTLYSDTNDYGQLPANCSVLSLKMKREQTLISRIRTMVHNLSDVNHFIGTTEEYALITAHLQMSHVLASMTKVAFKTFYVVHGAQWPTDPNRSFRRRIALRSLFFKKRLVCVSQGIKGELIQNYGLSKDQCSVIYNPIDVAEIVHKSLEPISEIRDNPYILCVGRLNNIKRYDRAIQIFKSGAFDKTHLLVFLGKGDEEDELRGLVSDLGLCDKVIFAGFSSNPFAWMRHADIMLCTSDSEAFPMGLIEGLACGAKVVSADCDYGPREILTGKLNKYLVSPVDDIESYIRIIRDALISYPVISPDTFAQYEMKTVLSKYCNEWEKYYGK